VNDFFEQPQILPWPIIVQDIREQRIFRA
jgi:hypothetical protein